MGETPSLSPSSPLQNRSQETPEQMRLPGLREAEAALYLRNPLSNSSRPPACPLATQRPRRVGLSAACKKGREREKIPTKTAITLEHSPNWAPLNNTAPRCINGRCGNKRPGALIHVGITENQLPLLESLQASFQIKGSDKPCKKENYTHFI